MPDNLKSIPDKHAANPQPKPMTKAKIFQKILADQKIIREALQNGIPLKELEEIWLQIRPLTRHC